MDEMNWKNTKNYLELRRQIRLEIIKEIQETAGCKKCPRFKRITERDLLYKEKR